MMLIRTFAAGLAAAIATPVLAGSIFITGHDPDFHSTLGGNPAGAQRILQSAVTFAKDGSALPLLYIHDETNPVLSGHVNSTGGLTAAGIAFQELTAAQFATANLANYSAIFIPSSFGGNLSQVELDAVNTRTSDIIDFINAGGGLVALAETPDDLSLATTNLFGFMPFVVSSAAVDQSESGFTVTPFGNTLGLTDADVNGNASHNIFTQTGGMNVVDTDSAGRIMSLAYRGRITPEGVVPEPASLALLATAGIPLLFRRRRHA